MSNAAFGSRCRTQAWHAVTEAEPLGRWYAPSVRWEIPALEVSAQVKFYNSEAEILHATIEVVDPPARFALRWDAYAGEPIPHT